MSTAKEDTVENYLVERVKALGGVAIKLNPTGYKGLQDRLVVLPGRIIFCELKRPKGGRIAALQHYWHNLFTRLGHRAVFCHTKEQVDAVLDGFHRLD